MAWVKIDDNFSAHPKVLAAGGLAKLLFLDGLCYSARYLTDGFIPSAAVPMLVDSILLDLWYQGGGTAEDVAEQLVEVGLWERAKGGYQIHDYLDYNPSGHQVKARREAAARRQGRWRERQASQDEQSQDDEPEDNGVSDASHNAVSNGVPVPVPQESTTNVPADGPAREHLPSEPSPSKKPSKAKKPPTDMQRMYGAVAKACGIDTRTVTGGQRGALNQTSRILLDAGAQIDQVPGFRKWWDDNDWRGKRGEAPEPHQVREEWGRYMESLKKPTTSPASQAVRVYT